jgi:hypothetical protein
VNDLRSAVILHARVYEFLEHQDEATLQSIVSGTARLAVLRAGDPTPPANSAPREGVRADAGLAPRPATIGVPELPSNEPTRVAQDLSRLPSARERRLYLNAAGLRVDGLRKVAKLLGFVGYSKLNRPQLTELLAGGGPDRGGRPDSSAESPATSSAGTGHGDPEDERPTPAWQAQPTIGAPLAGSTESSVDAVAIASRLRETGTEEEGAVYLKTQHLDREGLLAVAAELQLTRVDRLSQRELEKRVLRQAIGARRKFAGLRRW